jgi:hypothetical protein
MLYIDETRITAYIRRGRMAITRVIYKVIENLWKVDWDTDAVIDGEGKKEAHRFEVPERYAGGRLKPCRVTLLFDFEHAW